MKSRTNIVYPFRTKKKKETYMASRETEEFDEEQSVSYTQREYRVLRKRKKLMWHSFGTGPDFNSRAIFTQLGVDMNPLECEGNDFRVHVKSNYSCSCQIEKLATTLSKQCRSSIASNPRLLMRWLRDRPDRENGNTSKSLTRPCPLAKVVNKTESLQLVPNDRDGIDASPLMVTWSRSSSCWILFQHSTSVSTEYTREWKLYFCIPSRIFLRRKKG